MPEVRALVTQPAKSMRGEPSLSVRVVDRPRRHSQAALIVEDVAGKERRLGGRPEADAPRGVPGSVHDRQAGDGFAVLQQPRLATGAGHDIAGETSSQP